LGIEDARVGRSDGDLSARAALEIEFRSTERQTIASFRESFLRWLNDRNGPLTRLLGAPDRMSLDELPPRGEPDEVQTLRLRVSWPASRPVSQAALLRSLASPTETDADALPAAPSRAPLAHYVFFPEPPQAEAPLFRQLTVPLSPSALQPPAGASRLRLERPSSISVLRHAAAFAGAVQAFVRRSAGAVSVSRLTMRVPAAAYRGAGRLTALGTAAVAAGFLAGTVYLTTMERPETAASAPQQALPRAETAPPAPGTSRPLPMAAPEVHAALLPPAVGTAPRGADADHVRRDMRASSVPASAANDGIPDTEVTPAPPPRPAAAKPAAGRRAGPVVVSARADAKSSAVMVGGRRMQGALLVKSEPQGAEVSINGVVHGRTPLLIRGVGAGSRVVRLALPGYARWSWAVPVAGDRETPINVKLQPESDGSGESND
jgi:hypothetical protein